MRNHLKLGLVLMISVLCLLIVCSSAYSSVIYVKTTGDDNNNGSTWDLAKQTITDALDTAATGDEIWVAAGTYNELIFVKAAVQVYGGFAGTETSRDDRNWEANQTIIDSSSVQGNEDYRSTVTFANGIGTNTSIDGFTIAGGTGTVLRHHRYGGGIYCEDRSSPTIANNHITHNSADSGAGIFCYNFSRPLIYNNIITDNTAEDWGGGIYCWYDPPGGSPLPAETPVADIYNNLITYNTASWGGGVAVYSSSVIIDGLPSAKLRDNIIYGNGRNPSDTSRYTESVGGGIYCEYVSPLTITGNNVYGNESYRSGGIHCSNSLVMAANNRVAANSAELGAGIGIYRSDATVTSNTIIGNMANARGGGIYCKGYSSSNLINNTVVSNTADTVGGGIYLEDSDPFVLNNIVAFNSEGIRTVSTIPFSSRVPFLKANCVYGNGNTDYAGLITSNMLDIHTDPKLAGVGYGNVHIQPDSPCVNAGYSAAIQPGWTDVDGQSRAIGVVDIGADESDGITWTDAPAIVIRVSTAGSDANDGSSWDQAKETIQAGVDTAAAYGGEVWVAAGEYHDDNVLLRPYVHLYGGFAGTETELTQRDITANETTITPTHDGSAITVQWGYRVSTIDGFTIGPASALGGSGNGAGILCYRASPTISNNLITHCIANANGAAIYCDYYSSPLIYANTITDCEAANGHGGAIYARNFSSPKILNNRISGNSAAIDGGAIYCFTDCSVVIKNNIIDNSSVEVFGDGGAIFCSNNASSQPPVICNNTIAWSTAVFGGAIKLTNSNAFMSNNILAYNSSGISVEHATPTISDNCMFNNGTSDYSGVYRGPGDIEADPMFIDGNNADPSLRNYHLQVTSPCIDTGEDSVVQTGDLDMNFLSRIAGAHVDMGAYEWRGPSNKSLSPNSGSLATNVQVDLTSVYFHPDGYEYLGEVYLLIRPTDWVFSGGSSVFVKYDIAANKLYVKNSANTVWLGGYEPGSANVIESPGFCRLYCENTTVSGSGGDLTVNWNIMFGSRLAGKKCAAWMLIIDQAGLRDGWDKMGNYIISSKPSNVSLSPNSGVLFPGNKVTLTSRYSDAEGYTDINDCYLLINSALTGVNGVYLRYDAKANKLYLRNNDNTAWVGGYSPGSAYVIDNSYARVYCQETTVSGAGAVRTVNWRVMFKSTMTNSTCDAWMRVQDNAGLSTGWAKMGSFIFDQVPTNVSLSPYRGTLVCDRYITYTTKFADSDGNADIANVYLLMNTTSNGSPKYDNGVFVKYDSVANKLYLRNDANTAFIGGITPGDTGIIENSQCLLDCSQTTISRSGTELTVNWEISLKSTMADKTIFAWLHVIDQLGQRDNHEKFGEFRTSNSP